MNRWWSSWARSAPIVLSCLSVEAQEAPAKAGTELANSLTLSLEQALERAVVSAPRVLAARAQILEAESASVGARIYPRSNPTLEAAVGPRVIASDATPAVALQFMQILPLGGGVSARLAAVDAGVAHSAASAEAVTQELQRAVASAYVRTLWAEERLSLAQSQITLAQETQLTTEQRVSAGDSTRLEVNVAKLGVSRALAEAKDVQALRDGALGELRILLGLPHEVALTLSGKLSELSTPDLASLLARSKNRPDLRALAAQLRAAEAEREVASLGAFPDFGVGLRYEHEETNVHAVMGVFSLSLHFFDYGQGDAAVAQAKSQRAIVQLQQRQIELPIEVRTAFEVLNRRREAVLAFDPEPTFAESLELAAKAYKAGETSLSDLLILRGEIIETKRAFTDRLLAARVAEIELRSVVGVWP